VEAPARSRGFAALVMLATFALVGWLTIQTARAVQAELEAQATKKSILISRSLERAILNLKNTATALSHSHELQIDDLRDFYDLAKPNPRRQRRGHFAGFRPRHQRIGTRRNLTCSRRFNSKKKPPAFA
jgi:hypothetical protein